MNGTGAIGVPQGLPGVHKGKCVQCHMAPTSSGHGGVQLGGNHTFKVIYPKVAAAATAGTTTGMPFSACSTCHSEGTTPSNATPDPLATNVQPIADAHQAKIKGLYAKTTTDLQAAGERMGYAQPPATKTAVDPAVSYISWLNNTLNAKGTPSTWSPDELKWQQAYTDWTYISAEGSWGIHNWQYDSLVITAAETFANQVDKTPQTLTLKLSKTSVKKNTKVTFSGTVSPVTGGTVQIQKKNSSGVFVNWKSATLSGGKYSVKVKMTSKGTFYFKAFLAPNPSYAGGTSGQVKLVVKK